VITWKAWALPAMGRPLTYVAGVVTFVLVLLQIRRRPGHQCHWWPLLGYTILVIIIGLIVRATFTPQSFQRPLEIFRVDLATAWLAGIDMSRARADFANLQGAVLSGANLQEARLQGAVALWLLGYPDQAVQWSQEALTQARELAHP